MSTLTVQEKIKLEKLFKMEGGYVSNYSDATFAMAIAESMNIDSNLPEYQKYGFSKAKRLRAIWEIESDDKVASQINHLDVCGIHHQNSLKIHLTRILYLKLRYNTVP